MPKGSTTGSDVRHAVSTCFQPTSSDVVVTPTSAHVPVVVGDKVISPWSPRPEAWTDVIPVALARCAPSAAMNVVQSLRKQVEVGTAMVTTFWVCSSVMLTSGHAVITHCGAWVPGRTVICDVNPLFAPAVAARALSRTFHW